MPIYQLFICDKEACDANFLQDRPIDRGETTKKLPEGWHVGSMVSDGKNEKKVFCPKCSDKIKNTGGDNQLSSRLNPELKTIY